MRSLRLAEHCVVTPTSDRTIPRAGDAPRVTGEDASAMAFAAVLRIEPAPPGTDDVLREHAGEEASHDIDGLTATFSSAAAALACAAALAGEGAERIGIDAGEDAFDATLVATRLCEAARTGQVLVSETVRLLAGRQTPAAIRPAGALRLRGVTAPVGIAELLPGEAPLTVPARDAPIRVVIADDQALLRAGFRVIVEAEPDMTVVGEAGDGRVAVDVVRRLRPDVVLMDIRMPELDGLRAAEAILGDPDGACAVLMLTTFDTREYVYDALRMGASGFLLKDAPAARLLDAIRVAAAGDALLEPSITRQLIEQFARVAAPPGDGPPDAVAALTARELEVLRLLARGMSNAEIAAELVLGEETIKTHVGRILSKLGLRDRVQAVVLAYETGLARSHGM
jgi:DNA-binding NarL/FixJ family response regulator